MLADGCLLYISVDFSLFGPWKMLTTGLTVHPTTLQHFNACYHAWKAERSVFIFVFKSKKFF